MLLESFKPCYKWNTFNTVIAQEVEKVLPEVLNLVISGIPSIRYKSIRVEKTENY